MRKKFQYVLILLLTVFGLSGCGGGGGGGGSSSLSQPAGPTDDKSNNAKVKSLVVTPARPSLAAGTALQLTATTTLADGNTLDETSAATWTSSDPTVETVSTSGLVTSMRVGVATVQATFSGVSGSTPVTVTSAKLATIQVTPAAAALAAGIALQYHATGFFTDGTTQDLTSTVLWSASGGATASSTGVVTASQPGTPAIIQAALMGVTGSTSAAVSAKALSALQVTPPQVSLAVGTSVQLQATAIFSDGTTQDVSGTVSWSADNGLAVTASGLATAGGSSPAQVTASLNGLAASAAINQSAARVTGLVVTPANATMPAGAVVQFTATGLLSDGTTQDVTSSVSWISQTTGTATIASPGGVATTLSSGSTIVQATLGTVQGSTTLGVTTATLATLVVSPSNPVLAVGASEAMQATGTFTDGSTQNLTAAVGWTVQPTTGTATISTGGTLIGVQAGAATVRAMLNGVQGQTAVTVGTPGIVKMTVQPSQFSMDIGTTLQMRAIVLFTDGTLQDVTPSVNWSTGSSASATITSPGGLLTAVSSGSTTVKAVFGGQTVSTTVFLNGAHAFQTLQILPGATTIAAGTSLQYKVLALLDSGQVTDVTSSATWRSGTPAVATITSPGGLAAGIGAGSSLLTATLRQGSSNLTVSTTLTVTSSPVTALVVSPSAPLLATGTSLQLHATATFGDGTQQDVTSQTSFIGQGAAISTGSPNGLVSALSPGSAGVQATFGGVTTSITVQVRSATLSSIFVTPANARLRFGGITQQFHATGVFEDGSEQDVTTSASWTVSDPSAATITLNGGLLTTGGHGATLTVSASLQGVTGTTVVQLVEKFLYIARGFAGIDELSISAIDGSPALLPVAQSTSPTRFAVQSLQTTTDGHFVIAVEGSDLSSYSADPATGELSFLSETQFLGVAAIAPSGRFVYLSTNQQGLQILRLDPQSGLLTLDSTAVANKDLGAMAISSDGSRLYVVDGLNNQLLGFSVDSTTGALTPLPGSPYPAAANIDSLAVHPSGRFLYAGAGSTVSVLALDTQGNVGSTPTQVLSGNGLGSAVFFDPTGRCLIAGSSTLSIDPGTGTLTVASQGVTVSPVLNIGQDAAGTHLYVRSGTQLQVWLLDPSTFVPTLVSSQTLP